MAAGFNETRKMEIESEEAEIANIADEETISSVNATSRESGCRNQAQQTSNPVPFSLLLLLFMMLRRKSRIAG